MILEVRAGADDRSHRLLLAWRMGGRVSVLRGVITEASPTFNSFPFFLFSFFCIPFFALNSAYVSCQLCRYIGQNGPFKRSTITGGGNVCEVKMAWVVPPWHSSDPRKSRPSLYNREASKVLLFKVDIHVVSEAGWHAAGIAKKK